MKLSREETIITDATTGGKKASKLARFGLIPWEFLWALAEHYGRGARKYDDNNWLKGYDWSLSYDALERHLQLWRSGERDDPETGSHHLICVAWHACAMFIFQVRGLGTDNVTATLALLNPPPLPPLDVPRRVEDGEHGCLDQSTTHWVCERQKGHTGPHMA